MKTFVTHPGNFHADDVFGAAILKIAHTGEEIDIIRSSKPAVIAAADLAFDIGGGPFDHHQRGGNGERPNGVKYASAGLLWATFGALCVVPQILPGVELEQALAIAERVDQTLIQSIDAQDNGQCLRPADGQLDYREVSLSSALVQPELARGPDL